MFKSQELSTPGSCFNRARDDEMMFILLDRDPAAALVVREWVRVRVLMGKNEMMDSQIQEALRAASYMEDHQMKEGPRRMRKYNVVVTRISTLEIEAENERAVKEIVQESRHLQSLNETVDIQVELLGVVKQA